MHLFKGFSLYLLHLTGSLINCWVKLKDLICIFCIGAVILFIKKILYFRSPVHKRKKKKPFQITIGLNSHMCETTILALSSVGAMPLSLLLFSGRLWSRLFVFDIPRLSFLYLCPFPTKVFFPILKTPVSSRSLPSPRGKIILRKRSNSSHLQLRVNLVQ